MQPWARARWVLLAWAVWIAAYPLTHWLSGNTLWLLVFPSLGAGAGFLTLAWVLRQRPATEKPSLLGVIGQWVGQRSYGCYLYHLLLPVFYQRVVYHLLPLALPQAAALRQFWLGPLPTVLVLTPLLLALAGASWAWVEAPLEQLKKYLPYA